MTTNQTQCRKNKQFIEYVLFKIFSFAYDLSYTLYKQHFFTSWSDWKQNRTKKLKDTIMGIPVWGQRVGKWRLSRFKCGLIKHVIFNYHIC